MLGFHADGRKDYLGFGGFQLRDFFGGMEDAEEVLVGLVGGAASCVAVISVNE
jgi:hypothetical protein